MPAQFRKQIGVTGTNTLLKHENGRRILLIGVFSQVTINIITDMCGNPGVNETGFPGIGIEMHIDKFS